MNECFGCGCYLDVVLPQLCDSCAGWARIIPTVVSIISNGDSKISNGDSIISKGDVK